MRNEKKLLILKIAEQADDVGDGVIVVRRFNESLRYGPNEVTGQDFDCGLKLIGDLVESMIRGLVADIAELRAETA